MTTKQKRIETILLTIKDGFRNKQFSARDIVIYIEKGMTHRRVKYYLDCLHKDGILTKEVHNNTAYYKLVK